LQPTGFDPAAEQPFAGHYPAIVTELQDRPKKQLQYNSQPPGACAVMTTRTVYLVLEKGDGVANCRLESVPLEPPGQGAVQVRLHWSALNYKDALCATGHPGVARRLPMVPGIDGVGEVIQSAEPRWRTGQPVLVGDARFGTETDGGFATAANLPADWLWPLPAGLSLREAAILGTAGFTAAQCVLALREAGVQAGGGPVVVTGATGGVGVMAVMILAQLGYEVVAVSGKPDRAAWLRELGAAEVCGRDIVNDPGGRPLLSARWAGAVDTAGGNLLGTILRSTRPGGCVAACGLVAGSDLPVSVYPFILRGVRLQGIDSGNVSAALRMRVWDLLAGEWKPRRLDAVATETGLSQIGDSIRSILAGQIAGRVIVDLSSPAP
jgi:putative YhdH/YhfP family quinone oxidoreductase